jgi:hypothetical protein
METKLGALLAGAPASNFSLASLSSVCKTKHQSACMITCTGFVSASIPDFPTFPEWRTSPFRLSTAILKVFLAPPVARDFRGFLCLKHSHHIQTPSTTHPGNPAHHVHPDRDARQSSRTRATHSLSLESAVAAAAAVFTPSLASSSATCSLPYHQLGQYHSSGNCRPEWDSCRLATVEYRILHLAFRFSLFFDGLLLGGSRFQPHCQALFST